MSFNQGYIPQNHLDKAKTDDVYFTPSHIARVAMAELAMTFPDFEPVNCLEPGGGLCAHLDQAVKIFPGISTTSVDPNSYGEIDDVHEDLALDFMTWETNEKFDLIATNPPFTLAHQFLEKSYDMLTDDGLGLFLLRYSFVATLKRRELWRKVNLRYIWVLVPRPSFVSDGKSTDACEYAYFIFSKGRPGRPVLDWIEWRKYKDACNGERS